MAQMKPWERAKELQNRIRRGEIPPFIILHGEAAYQVDKIIKQLIKQVIPTGGEDLFLNRLDALKLDFSDLADIIETPPFGAGRKLVLVRNVDRMLQLTWEKLIKLAVYPGIPDFVVLVLYGYTKKLPRRVPTKKGLKELFSKKERERLFPDNPKNPVYLTRPETVLLNAPFENQIPAWIARYARDKLNVSVAPAAALELLATVGKDQTFLIRELEKLAVFIHPRTTIQTADVKLAATPIMRETVFVFLDAICDRKCARALEALGDVMDEVDSCIVVFRMLAKRIRMLIQARGIANRTPKISRELVALSADYRKLAPLTDVKSNVHKKNLRAKAEPLVKKLKEAVHELLPTDKKSNLLKQNIRNVLTCFHQASRLNEDCLGWMLLQTVRAENETRLYETALQETILDKLVLTLCTGNPEKVRPDEVNPEEVNQEEAVF